MNICTIVAKNYVAHARVLAESFNEHHHDGTCFALIIDDFSSDQINPATEPFKVLRPTDLDLAPADFDDMRSRYTVLEFSTAVKPWLLRHMLDAHDDGSGVAYFDPDIRVFSRMTELETALSESSIVLTPHLTTPMPRDGMKPSETDIMIAGIYNLGFIGLSNGADAHALIQFWEERLRTDCVVAPEQGLFVDQKWIDWIPGLLTDLTILREPAYNVAYWNLPTRKVSENDGGYLVDERPLRFFHYSGYGPDHPTMLSKHQNRIQLKPGTPLLELCEQYRERLLANDFEAVRSYPYSHNTLPSGVAFDPFARALYRDGIDAGVLTEAPFSVKGERDLLAWMNEAAPQARGVSRYLYELWSQRADLQQAYPDLEDTDLEGFRGWCNFFGRTQVPIAERMLNVPGQTGASPATSEAAPVVPTPAQPAAATPPPKPLGLASDLSRPFGVNVAGYLRSELGIGEVARQMVRALDTNGVPTLARVLSTPGSRQGQPFVTGTDHPGPYPTNLVFVNADGFPAFAKEAGPEYFEGRHTIGYWWWELPTFPEEYQDSFDLVDEIWVGSEFVAKALQAKASVPVIHMPVPVLAPQPPPLTRGEFGWPTDAFTFYFSWDYNSVFRRKNPLAVIEAFTSAFKPNDGAALVLKCINGDRDALHHHQLLAATADRPDITVIDDYVAARDKDRLMSTCDCYISLHRSEGLGLTMAEAMLFGKPVIATNYSGNTDFMTADNSYPVGYKLTPVGEGAFPYPADAKWAEPDTAAAAKLMRAVFDDPQAAAERGARGAETIRARYSSEAIGEAMAARLRSIKVEAQPVQPVRVAVPVADEQVGTLVARGTTPRAPSNFGKPGAALRKLLLRTLRPYTAYQSDVNHGLLALANRTDPLAASVAREITRIDLTAAEDLSTVLAELRLQRRAIEELVEAVSQESAMRERETSDLRRESETLTDTIAGSGLSRLLHESAAVPFMATDALGTFEERGVGQVFGYRDSASKASAGDEYRAFEELFRGSEEMIRERQHVYLPLLSNHGPVVDLGCGRGEMLDLLTEAGVDAIGVDSDAGMVRRCIAKGHSNTVEADALSYLRTQEDGSLGAIFSAQVIEHLPHEVLRELITLAKQKLRPGGLFIAETVNPHSVAALKTFWVDVTHQHPLFSEAIVAFCRIAGFRSAYVFYPNGTGNADADRTSTGEYAVVATA